MELKLLITIASGIFAAIAAIMTIYGQIRIKKIEYKLRREEYEHDRKHKITEIISRYREPLILSAFELQSRIFNIVRQDFADAYYLQGNDRERDYATKNTAFVICQYFGWLEIVRSEVLFLDLGENEKTKELNEILDLVANYWLDDYFEQSFMIFRGDQRGIGEQMIVSTGGRATCLGYATFHARLDCGEAAFLKYVHDEVEKYFQTPLQQFNRLINIQHALIDLLDFLDPDCKRIPSAKREKI